MFDAETNEEVKNAGINAVSIQVQIFNDFPLNLVTFWPLLDALAALSPPQWLIKFLTLWGWSTPEEPTESETWTQI